MSEEKPLNVPEYLLIRSAEARAKHLGISVEQALAEIKGESQPVAKVEEPVAEVEEPVEEVVEEVEEPVEEEPVEEVVEEVVAEEEPVVEEVVAEEESIEEPIEEPVEEPVAEVEESVEEVSIENKTVESIPAVTIRFAGDSGDGMQLVGTRFTDTSALFGNDLATLPAFPAEIRAPQGTVAGVSSFQVQIADFDILTPGDAPDVLVAMNPAALKAHLQDLTPNGMLILNEDAFDEKNIKKAGYEIDPRESEELDGYRIFQVPMEKLTKEALEEFDLPGRAVLRSKNMIALGLISWTFNRDLKDTENWINEKFKNLPEVAKANIKALKTGYNFGITVEAFHHTYKVDKASLPAGEYTNINGNIGLSWGLIAGAKKANLELFYGSYPITPASDILHELSKHKNFNVLTFQAEDEIAAAAAAVGASFTGKLAVTGTSGPGLALKSETISLALSAELPLVVVNVQRGGPSTGLPTKPEQSDLMFAMYGRHGEAPLPVIAAKSPSHAFYAAFEATRIALKYMTPVILLSDNYVATGSEPWKLPEIDSLNELGTNLTTTYNTENGFLPFFRDFETNARPWAIPGTPGLEHRVGGLEKEDGTGNVSYDTDNHQYMTDMRAWKIENIANDIDQLEINGDTSSDTLILGWGSTFGGITQAVNRLNSKGIKVASAHFTHVNPFPDNTAEVLSQFKNIIVPELNTGQLSKLLRARYLVDTVGINKVEGLPFTAQELEEKIESLINSFGTKLEPIVEEVVAEEEPVVEEVVAEVVAEEEPVVEEVVEEVVAEEEPQEEVGIPEHLIMRSAEARAKALGIPVEQVLEEMSADKPAAETEEPVIEEAKSDKPEEPAAETQEPVVERVVERVTERVTERIIEKVDETLPENKELVQDVEEERNKVDEEKKEEVKTDE